MEKTGSIETFNELLMDERAAWLEHQQGRTAAALANRRGAIHSHLKEVGQRGDIGLIFATEKALLVTDLTLYANSKAMTTSLQTALKELQAAEKSLPLVHDPVLYKAVDDSHGHPKSRAGAVPKDAVRQFCASNAARLLNMDKSRLDGEEKGIVEERKRNMRTAEKLYTVLQQNVLGVVAAQDRGQGLAR